MTKVLVVATSRKTRGGITSVVKAYENGEQWNKFHCKWIETHIDKNAIWKISYLIIGFIKYVSLLPFYDIVHIHISEPISAIRKIPFMYLACLLNKKTIVHFHSFSADTTTNGRYKCIYKYMFGKANAIVVLSEFWKKAVADAFCLDRTIHIIYNPCTTEVLPTTYPKKKQILYAGTVNARKGYADMIKAFAMIAKENPAWKIVFAGNGEIEQGKSLARSLGISTQIEFLGWVSGKDKDKTFKESSIFCLPSYAEGFPMGVLDAWAYGLPVITTPVGGIPDIAIDGKNLLLFDPGDYNSLALQMNKMIKDNILRECISKESVKLAQEIFNVKTICKKVEELYKNI